MEKTKNLLSFADGPKESAKDKKKGGGGGRVSVKLAVNSLVCLLWSDPFVWFVNMKHSSLGSVSFRTENYTTMHHFKLSENVLCSLVRQKKGNAGRRSCVVDYCMFLWHGRHRYTLMLTGVSRPSADCLLRYIICVMILSYVCEALPLLTFCLQFILQSHDKPNECSVNDNPSFYLQA